MKALKEHKKITLYLKGNELNFNHLNKFDVKSAINEHATMELEAILYEENIKQYNEEMPPLQPIQAVVTDGENTTVIFEGLVYTVDIQVVGGLGYLYLKAISYSYQLDIALKNRSFQDKNETYKEVIKQVMADHERALFNFSDISIMNQKINHPYVQYQETDWEFLKRLVSKFNIGLVPAIGRDGIKIWFGAQNEETAGDITEDVYEYKMEKDFKTFKDMEQNHKKDIGDIDFVSFKVRMPRVLFIGTQVFFNKIKLYIKEVHMTLKDSELHLHYSLVTAKGLSTKTISHQKLSGVSLNGKVLQVKEHVVKVHLDIDPKQDKQKAYWFPFATVSASPNNVGWYFMPEVGDGVRVYFEDGKEENGVAIQAVPINPSYKDPNVRYISTIHGKEIKIAQGGIYITVKGEELYIKLDDEEGISICSDTCINMIAKEDIHIVSDTKIELAAQTIAITSGENGETSMIIQEDVIVDAKQVTVNRG
jgi:phage baseplate assembly protein gpV